MNLLRAHEFCRGQYVWGVDCSEMNQSPSSMTLLDPIRPGQTLKRSDRTGRSFRGIGATSSGFTPVAPRPRLSQVAGAIRHPEAFSLKATLEGIHTYCATIMISGDRVPKAAFQTLRAC